MKSTTSFRKMKREHDSIAMVTAYDYPSAKLAEEAGVDLILVGDSMGNVVLGYDSTVPVTMEDMILHTRAVNRGAPNTFVVTDMPFMSYHVSEEETMLNAKRLIQEGGARAVKLEGAGRVGTMIERLTAAGVPVVGHLGLTPQSVGVLGGHKIQGKDAEAARILIEDAKKIEAAGAFMLVLECVPWQLAERVSEAIQIPTIGIGAGPKTDGQVLVYHDLIGYGGDWSPKFAKRYANVSETIRTAIGDYVSEVKSGKFPEEKHSFTMKEEEMKALYGGHQE
ncbi:MAG TPA: 3-methyl-2-oxobutanoate hydroxymethyltransferase [Bacillales bacterium]|nr:3-methyl-2-oxobutanoate hydroxymethyltransferase [Bacillales bacterium]